MPDDQNPRDSRKEKNKSRRITLMILAIYGLLAIIMTWPVITKLGTDLAGGHSDLWIHQWTFWWIKQALLNGLNPFYTSLIYYPSGVSLTSHNIAWFNVALWLPLQAIIGNTAAYNLIFIAVYTLNGFVFYLFAYELTDSRPASFIGGVVFGFWPYTLSHNDHPNMVVLFWVPLTLIFLHRTYMRQQMKYALLAAVSVAMIGITRWQLLVMSAPILLAYVLYLFLTETNGRKRHTVGLFLLTGVLAFLLMAPLASPLVRDQLARNDTADVTVLEKEGVTDLLSYVIPPVLYNHFWRDVPFPSWFLEPYENIAASVHYIPFVGYLTIILAIYGAVRGWSKTWFWTLLLLMYFFLALGSTFTFDGQRFTMVPMPYRLLGESLIATLIRRPHRLNLFLSMPVAMLVTFAMVDILQRIRLRMPRRETVVVTVVTLATGLIILWENPISPPFPTTSTEIPLWYQQLAEDPDQFGILELPTYDRGFDKIYMFYQIQHGKPITGGHVSRLPSDANEFRESIPFLQPMLRQDSWLVQLEDWVDFSIGDISRQFRQIADENVRYVVVNKTLLTDGALERWIDWVTFDPMYEDDVVLVYRSEPQSGTDFTINKNLSDGIGLIRATYQPREANQAGTVKLDVRWGSESAPDGLYQVCVSLRNALGARAAGHCMDITAKWPTNEWEANEVVRGSYTVPIDPDLEPGDYTLEMFLSDDGQESTVGETAVLGDVHVHSFQPEKLTVACWDEKICLKGYDLQQNQEMLDLVTYWQAPQALDASYKIFVHLVDVTSGEVVVQSDAIPRGWTYPTGIWEPGEIVRDPISLSLENVAPGHYTVLLGWYNVENGERLRTCPTGECDLERVETYQLTTIDVTGE